MKLHGGHGSRNGGGIYSRNIAHQQLFVSKYAQKTAKENQNAELLPSDLPDFKVVSHGDNALLTTEVQGKNPWIATSIF